ncbi:hypothetical protein LJ207_01275 [Halanaerobium sp. Z-7514]|uniref:DUF5668 domain-containing protein n=1 Tax=Halanaerobium polyolivorans TaxID=2886943 RepID=A0AAW4WS85_9FIRM|nr:hypothetical protein [Halanaerobium polyolivorans]MCC3143953.1 hypothetical protein [Halanaerobium polyolivorans]RQD71668.1 MAG: hypothetical protein D5S01_09720 [Halanaerobium sp. MSAO_Bac5]
MDKKKLGIILIVIGIFLLLNTLNLIGEDIFIYFLGGGFIVAYFAFGARKYYRNIGFLIPGSILLALALFSDLQRIEFFRNIGGGLFFILLGSAFLIVFIHTRAFSKWDWPIYPGLALFIFGLFIITVEKTEILKDLTILNYLFPILLIAAGGLIIFKQKEK